MEARQEEEEEEEVELSSSFSSLPESPRKADALLPLCVVPRNHYSTRRDPANDDDDGGR